jgi:hypothetical protein
MQAAAECKLLIKKVLDTEPFNTELLGVGLLNAG